LFVNAVVFALLAKLELLVLTFFSKFVAHEGLKGFCMWPEQEREDCLSSFVSTCMIYIQHRSTLCRSSECTL